MKVAQLLRSGLLVSHTHEPEAGESGNVRARPIGADFPPRIQRTQSLVDAIFPRLPLGLVHGRCVFTCRNQGREGKIDTVWFVIGPFFADLCGQSSFPLPRPPPFEWLIFSGSPWFGVHASACASAACHLAPDSPLHPLRIPASPCSRVPAVSAFYFAGLVG